MEYKALISQFNQALFWNAQLYAVSKCVSMLVTLVLYHRLDMLSFSQWAKTVSMVYLAVLWVDGGLRKSIPRYIPYFMKMNALDRFIKYVIGGQIVVLTLFMPFFSWCAMSTQSFQSIGIYALLLFFTEGIISLIRLLYHAQFLNKSFNLIQSHILIIEAAITLICAYCMNPDKVVCWLFRIKIIGNSATCIIIALSFMKKLPQPFHVSLSHQIPSLTFYSAMKEFIGHTLFVWMTTFLKSLSERNFFLPFIYVAWGPSTGNLFKIANDNALIFQRIVIKTIGTADTSFLSHASANCQQEKPEVFRQLTYTIKYLCRSIFGIACLMPIGFYLLKQSFELTILVGLLLIAYMVELMLLPFERTLEVYRNYRALMTCYGFYTISLSVWYAYVYHTSPSLLGTVLGVCLIRLISLILIKLWAETIHALTSRQQMREFGVR